MNPKQIAAEHAVSYIRDGMTVGLGTGSTAAFAIAALARRMETESLQIRCVATSLRSEEMAIAGGLALLEWDDIHHVDITVDGADEVDPGFRLIKGGGGALFREKIVAAASIQEIIVVDDSKVKATLGAHPLPVVVSPFGWSATAKRIAAEFGCAVSLRKTPSGEAFLSDDGLYVVDCAFGAPLPSPDTLEAWLKTIVGVVEVGLFVGLCQRLVIGYEDGQVEERVPNVNTSSAS